MRGDAGLDLSSTSAPFLQQQSPVEPAGSLGRSPVAALNRRQRNLFPRERAKPRCFVGSGLQFDGNFALFRQIYGINVAGFREAESAVVDQLVMRLRFPPLEASEEVHHVL